MSYRWCQSSDMNKSLLTISRPYTHENLTIFLLHAPDRIDGSRYISLKKAFEKKKVRVYETGTVGQLEAENLSETVDIFIQAGDVLKGGRQDRTLGIDFIIPARSGRLPIPTFCVESGRWHRRRGEDAVLFSCSTHSLHSKKARMAAKVSMAQDAVWDGVAESQKALGAALKKSILSAQSPTSYQLSVEDADLEKRKVDFQKELSGISEKSPDTIGYAFYVNGQRNSADIYASTKLFHMLWKKLLDVAVLEAISASNGAPAVTESSNAQAWLSESAEAKVRDNRRAAPRTRLATKEYQTGTVFETFDEAVDDRVILHTSIISY
jgi:ARG and Rhodanese-Phosphatase-superfamily-associated Protein domain